MSSRSLRFSTKKKKGTNFATNSSELVVRFVSDDDVGNIITWNHLLSGSIKVKKKPAKVLTASATKQGSIKKAIKKEKEKEVKKESDEETDLPENDTCEKPTGLCDENDVAGDKICSFRTPKKRKGMLQKAIESASKNKSDSGTPKNKTRTPSRSSMYNLTPTNKLTPKRNTSSKKQTPDLRQKSRQNCTTSQRDQNDLIIPKTPYGLRARQKKAIQNHMKHLEAVDDSEDSDYQGSDNTDSEAEDEDHVSEEEDTDSDSGKGSEEVAPSCRRSLRFQPPTCTPSSRKRGKDLNYVFTADDYFHSKSKKFTTSDHRLSRLSTPRLDSSVLRNLLTQCSVSKAHQDILTQKRTDDSAMFQRWMFALSQGFSVLAYGLGSKYKILQKFHQEMLSNSLVLVVNGFFPSLNIKEIVEVFAKDLLDLKLALPSPHAIIDWIESQRWTPRVFLIIHNLDAEMLRCEKTQRILSRLASLPKVHLIASVDHINCPLLWDQAKLSGFNFLWEDTTSFLPYQEETSYETSLMVQNSGALALTSLLNVYRSLTHNSRGVFRIILDKHLHENDQKYTGMAFSELYSRCREEMLVTSDLALRTMLTEFLDHQMVKWRRDGEHLYIPIDTNILRQFQQSTQDS